MKEELGRLGVKIIYNTKLTPELAEKEKADIIISAVGADLLRPTFPGSDSDKVLMAEEADKDIDSRVGQNVAVIGGGLVGIETAINQALRGKNVSIIEMQDKIGVDANFRYARTYIWKIEELGIKVYTNTKCLEINDEGVKCLADNGEIMIKADTVVMAIGMKSRETDSEALRFCAPVFRSIGNCVKPGQIVSAIREGFDAGIFTNI